MRCRLIHTNHLGKICSQHGDVCRNDTTAQTEFFFDSLDEARRHANSYTQRFPELECAVESEDGAVQEIIRNEIAQSDFIRRYCRVPTRDRMRDFVLLTLFIASLISNIVMAVLLLRRP